MTEKEEEIKTTPSFSQKRKADLDRWKMGLASKFVSYFFGIIVLILVGSAIYNFALHIWINDTDALIDIGPIITTITSSLSSILAFVLGYYFKTIEQD